MKLYKSKASKKVKPANRKTSKKDAIPRSTTARPMSQR